MGGADGGRGQAETGEKHGAVNGIAKQLGIGVESLRQWVNQADVNAGRRAGTTSAGSVPGPRGR